MAYFLDNDNTEAAKMVIFKDHIDLWSDIKEDVRAYTLANWARWEREKPAWFDDNFSQVERPRQFHPEGDARRTQSEFGGGAETSSVQRFLSRASALRTLPMRTTLRVDEAADA